MAPSLLRGAFCMTECRGKRGLGAQWPPELASFANTGRELLSVNQFLGPPKPLCLVGLKRPRLPNRPAVRPDTDNTRRTPQGRGTNAPLSHLFHTPFGWWCEPMSG